MWRRQHRRGVSNPAIELRERISKQIPSDIEEMLLWMISSRRQYTRWGCRRRIKKIVYQVFATGGMLTDRELEKMMVCTDV